MTDFAGNNVDFQGRSVTVLEGLVNGGSILRGFARDGADPTIQKTDFIEQSQMTFGVSSKNNGPQPNNGQVWTFDSTQTVRKGAWRTPSPSSGDNTVCTVGPAGSGATHSTVQLAIASGCNRVIVIGDVTETVDWDLPASSSTSFTVSINAGATLEFASSLGAHGIDVTGTTLSFVGENAGSSVFSNLVGIWRRTLQHRRLGGIAGCHQFVFQ